MATDVVVIGLGVIGGSLALALRDRSEWRVTGYAASAADRRAAEESGIHIPRSLEAAVLDGERGVIVIAVPLDHIAAVAADVLTIVPRALILHTGSLQRAEAMRLADAHRDRVYGAHPLAGTHATGFGAARADLFRDASVSIESRTPAALRTVADAMWSAAGARRIDARDAEAHDALMSWVSHLPQLVATALASTLAEQGVPADACGPGARDTTRLAGSALELWRPILARAPETTIAALRSLGAALRELEQAVSDGDRARIEARWERARAWRADVVTPT